VFAIKEIYYTIQGEGYHTGKPAIFCRFAGCNLWSGLEKDRASAICKFCDTEFHGTDGILGGKYSLEELTKLLLSLWPKNHSEPFVVFTGGEPALQLTSALCSSLHAHNFTVAIETNGTLELCEGIDWVCVSPKANTIIVTTKGHELKLVHPQENNGPELFQSFAFEHFYLQPLDSPELEENTIICLNYCKENPQWKLSLQTHKILNIP